MDRLRETSFKHLSERRQGKVRDIYDLIKYLFIVTTDRLSAFDVVMPDIISRKGIILNQISLFWFKKVEDIISNHIAAARFEDCPKEFSPQLNVMKDLVKDRSVLVKKALPLPVECIVRGYLSGSGWNEYQKSGTVCNVRLSQGLVESSKLDEPIFTPSTKATEGHDINISFDEMIKVLFDFFNNKPHNEDAALENAAWTAKEIKEKSLAIYARGAEMALHKGIIIADTKMEFGLYDGKLILIDELLTPDSSRFWSVKNYQPGRGQDSFDKQIVRDYLLSIGWNGQSRPGPTLPEEILKKTEARYQELYNIITG
jgi:phosphoribosylaminoimidazole-succinocarboxamide synthase